MQKDDTVYVGLSVDLQIVWDTATMRLPELIGRLEGLLPNG